jgi:peptidyl-prolyl cis-trans isomerase C
MQRLNTTLLSVIPLLLLGAIPGCDRDDELRDPAVVAQAGDFRLGVEDAARMIAGEGDIPPDRQVIQALSDFWGDYVLLAWVANEEGELDRLDLDPLIRQQTEQELVMRLRDHVIEADPQISDDELRAFFEEEHPGDEVRARHILLLYPDQPTSTQLDSIRALAEQLRDRALGGADFENLAREYSEDPGSAGRGGDLGYFGRGLMVPPFEEAAFSLEPGEISDVVETQYGLHVIRSEDRRQPDFEEIQEGLREELKSVRTMRAESTFVADLEERGAIQIETGAVERLREITGSPEGRLSNRDGRRALASFQGGAFTGEDYRQFLLTQDRGIRDQILNASEEQLEDFLMNLSRGQLLVLEARSQGLEIPSGEVEELRRELRREYRSAAESLGLSGITPEEGESLREAVDREARATMHRLITGEQELIPLQALALPLRVQYGIRLSEPGIERAIERIREIRDEEGIEEIEGGIILEPGAPMDDPGPPDGEGGA